MQSPYIKVQENLRVLLKSHISLLSPCSSKNLSIVSGVGWIYTSRWWAALGHIRHLFHFPRMIRPFTGVTLFLFLIILSQPVVSPRPLWAHFPFSGKINLEWANLLRRLDAALLEVCPRLSVVGIRLNESESKQIKSGLELYHPKMPHFPPLSLALPLPSNFHRQNALLYL